MALFERFPQAEIRLCIVQYATNVKRGLRIRD